MYRANPSPWKNIYGRTYRIYWQGSEVNFFVALLFLSIKILFIFSILFMYNKPISNAKGSRQRDQVFWVSIIFVVYSILILNGYEFHMFSFKSTFYLFKKKIILFLETWYLFLKLWYFIYYRLNKPGKWKQFKQHLPPPLSGNNLVLVIYASKMLTLIVIWLRTCFKSLNIDYQNAWACLRIW